MAESVNGGSDAIQPLLMPNTRIDDVYEGIVDYRGEKVSIGSDIGGWRSALLIIGAEFAETIAFYGISSNLINYLTGPLGQSTVTAAANINAWCGVVWMLPLLGAFIADSYLGRFRTIFFSSLIYILGLGFLTLSVVLPSLMSSDESVSNEVHETSSAPFLVILFFFSLYLVAVGKAGFKPCAEAFGADQFDEQNPEECTSKSSFFNWWYFGLCVGSCISRFTLTYVQDNISWGLGFGIPCFSMLLGLFVFLLGWKTYRFPAEENKENPLSRIAKVFVASAMNWRSTAVSTSNQEEGIRMSDNHIRVGAHQFKFLDKALIDIPNSDRIGSRKGSTCCSIDQVEDAKTVLRLVPIWLSCLTYAVVVAQSMTFFTKQGSTMNRTIKQGIQIPPASLLSFIPLTVIFFIPIYDRLFVPLARLITKNQNGISTLQRIGCGIFISTMSMILAALIEKKRLQTAFDFGLIDKPNETVPISLWWLVPQYLLFGLAEVFTMVGLQEFFYDQVPDQLRSVGLSLYFSIFGIGDFLSGFIIYAIDKITTGGNQGSWFSNNLNRAHLDYFYWFLAALSTINLVAYLYVSKFYLYKRGSSV
ncbi:hypothetical protein C5167_048938 [Papaver somniferum]|uniref:Major facilitator superfamily (MFS) profile domain-containing protein n=1 Tax=Papaver somniferum TaxID=3469 RepID=A0A4Y7KJC8_PAPSO|nr:protein NRT1/ PTR FAMILY 5.10-like [Papaver somniferum]RZC73453.1 hypothetical protein C5167_048938 [Papaver somniferum]